MRKKVVLVVIVLAWGLVGGGGCSPPATKGQVAPTATGPKPPQKNSPPVVQSIEILPKYVPPGGEAFARVVATDPDQDKLEYAWTIEGGEIFEGSTSSVARWRPAEKADKVTLTVTVKDGKGAYADKKTTLTVAGQYLTVEIPTPGPIKKGMHFLTYLSATSFDKVSAFSLKLEYNPTRVEMVKVSPDGILKNAGILTAVQFVKPGMMQVAFWQPEGEGISGNGLIASILMKALVDLTDPGEILLEIKGDENFPTFRDSKGKDMPVGIRAKRGGGKILVEEKEEKKREGKEEKKNEGENPK
ncbi:MAG: cohesin domain-containing protein [bacterium JZ-2024 1]